MRHATTNYRMIKGLVRTADANGGHYKFKSEGYMDLVVENLEYKDHKGLPVYSMTHYGEQNGDLMKDPDMTFAVDFDNMTVTPRSYQNDYLGVYQEVFIERDGKTLYSPSLLKDLDQFLWQWLKNIESQGFNTIVVT